MILIAEIFFVLINIGMALQHSWMIKDAQKKNPPDPRPIKHGWWTLGYLIFAGLVSYFNNSWVLAILSLLIRKVVFDLFLNIFLKRQLFYVSTETTSIIDKWHYKIFGKRSEIYMSIYLLFILVLNVLIYNKIIK